MSAGDLLDAAGNPPWFTEMRGLLIGGCCDDSASIDSVYPVLDVWNGLGVPQSRSSTLVRSQSHGRVAGPQYLDQRTMRASFGVPASDAATCAEKTAALVGVFQPVDDDIDAALIAEAEANAIPLVFSLPAPNEMGLPPGVYRVLGQPGRVEPTYELLIQTESYLRVAVEFVAVDPRIYANDESSGSVFPGEESGGFDAGGFDFPFGFGSATPGTFEAMNEGNFRTYCTFRVDAGTGGLTQFTVEHNETGDLFGMTISLNQGDYIEVDTKERTVLLNGTATRIGFVDRPLEDDWFQLLPGLNTFSFTASGGDTHTLSMFWRSAWML